MRATEIRTGVDLLAVIAALGALSGLVGCPPGPKVPTSQKADAASVAASQPAVDDEEAAAVNDWKPQVAPAASGMVAAGDPQKKFEGLADAYFASHPTRRVYIQVDKPMYQPGETIWVRTAAVNSAALVGNAGMVGVLYQLISPKGAVVLQKRVQQQSGAASNDFELPADVQGGEYTIKMVSDDGASEERTVVVSAYEPPRYKKKLDFIRKAYGPGDTVGATVEVKLPTGEPFAGKDLTAVLTLDGVELPRAKFKTDDKGSTVVKVPLPASIERGDGLLTVLVEAAGVTESVSKSVPIVLNKLQLAFYPEGGDLVAGLPSRVYFAAQNMIGKPADIEGRVVDDQGQTAANLRSYHDGMGRFDLMPATGRSYQVEISKPVGVVERYALPVAQATGCTMRSYDDPKGLEPTIRVAVYCTQPRSVVVNAVVREQRLGSASAEVKPGQPAIVHLPLTRPAMQGVARVTLFSDGLEPLAERLVYRGWHKDLQVKITPDKQSYAPRDKVTLTVETRDLAGEPIPAELALGAVDDTVVSFADDKTAHLLAHMFLEKEVQGKVEEPNYYYKTDKNKAPLALDMLLGTRGWRKFEWQQVLVPQPDLGAVATRGIEGGGGTGKGLLGKLGKVFAPGDKVALAPTGAAAPRPKVVAKPGRQAAPPPMAVDAVAKEEADMPQAAMAVAPPPAPVAAAPREMLAAGEPMAERKVAAAPMAKKRPAPAMDMKQEAQAEPMPADEAPMQAIGGLEQVRPVKAKRDLRAGDDEGRADGAGGKAAGRARRGGGMKDEDWAGNERAARRQVATWAKVRVFPQPSYTPNYDGPRNDFRETVFWNPSVKTDASGRTQVSFFLSDAVTSFRVFSEGFSTTGLAGRDETVINSKLPFFMEVKLPLEVSAGDLINLPLTLKNEQSRNLVIAMTSRFGSQLKLLEQVAPGSIDLAATSGRTLLYPLEVVGKMGATEVAFNAIANGLKDEFTRTLRVVPLGFPRNISYSGMLAKTAGHEFDLKGALDGSVVATVSFFPSPLADMLAGVESILQEPNGCFEQASSSNYPNIMVMQYLEERDAAEPELAERSSRLLESGYRKIAGYESPSRGYEWFGGDPGHEALSAYGLMEFVDMRAVYPGVDSTMIDRTKKWLYSRRDGRGGFTRNPRALDSFGSASPEVTNCYITWALSEAGMKDLPAELETVTGLGKQSKDPYIVALATATNLNMKGKGGDSAELAARLVSLQGSDGGFHGASHSITRSGGLSLEVETTSIAVLALLKSGSNFGQARKGVDWLMTARKRGGFGSTQATILALKALIAFDKAAKAMPAGGEIEVLVNGQVVQRMKFDKGRRQPLVFEGLEKNLVAGPNRLDVKLASTAQLPYALSIDYRSNDPATSPQVPLRLATAIAKQSLKMGETVRVTASLESTSKDGLPMTLIRVGIPGGLTFQNWQLKELVEKKLVDFYETRPREVILYFRALPPNAKKEVPIDLVANVPGTYTAPASSAYLYYTAEHKAWASPLKILIERG